MTQSAVEWLVEQVKSQKYIEDVDFEKAKEMEKQQIEDAFMVGVKNEKYRFDTKEQYYIETFKNK
jgi:hypothetical protein